jgi:hypothetical protein
MEECKAYDIFCWLGWLVYEIKLIFVGIYTSILDSITGLFTSIPTPDFLLAPVPSIPPSVIFFADLFMVPHGMAIMVSAYLLRFLVRRLPFIG